MLQTPLTALSSADHPTVGRAAGTERSVHLRVHHHPPVSGQPIPAGRNNSEPRHGAFADLRGHRLRDFLSSEMAFILKINTVLPRYKADSENGLLIKNRVRL